MFERNYYATHPQMMEARNGHVLAVNGGWPAR